MDSYFLHISLWLGLEDLYLHDRQGNMDSYFLQISLWLGLEDLYLHVHDRPTGVCVENKNPYSPACHVSINLQVPDTGISVENKNSYAPACHVSITLQENLKIYTDMTGR
jgi:hypothetical protein